MLCCALASFVGIRMTSLPVFRQTFAYSSLSPDPLILYCLLSPDTDIKEERPCEAMKNFPPLSLLFFPSRSMTNFFRAADIFGGKIFQFFHLSRGLYCIGRPLLLYRKKPCTRLNFLKFNRLIK